MHLVVDQVVQLQHVHVADRDRTLERIAGAAVVQRRLRARRGQALGLGDVVRVGELQHAADLFFGRAVEHRRRERHAARQVARPSRGSRRRCR